MAELGMAMEASNLLLSAVTTLPGVLNAILAADVAEQWQPLQLQQLSARVTWLKASILEQPFVDKLKLPLSTLAATLAKCTAAVKACTHDAKVEAAQIGFQPAAAPAGKKRGWLRRKVVAAGIVLGGSGSAVQLAAACQAVQREIDSIMEAAAIKTLLSPLVLAGGDRVPVPAAKGYVRDVDKFTEVRACLILRTLSVIAALSCLFTRPLPVP